MRNDMRELLVNGATLKRAVLTPQCTETLRNDAILRLPVADKCSDDGVAYTLPVDMRVHVPLIGIGARLLESIGLGDLRYIAGAIIPKYPGELMRPHHTDWWDWDSPETQWDTSPQYGVIFYLDAANTLTGKLLIVAGSHHPHWQKDFWNTVYLPAEAGDAVIIDSRTIHAVSSSLYLNEKPRIAITMWYLQSWEKLSEQVKSSTMLCISDEVRNALGDLCPDYTGTLPPKPHVKKRIFT